MIASLRGNVLTNNGQAVVLDVNGVGYLVNVTSATARELSIGEESFLHTSFIVREDSMSLYGFETQLELNLFDLLLSVSGVGPKSALGVLSAMTPGQIADAVAHENDAAFKAVSGIGPKTAKLIVVTLAGKLNHLGTGSVSKHPVRKNIDQASVIAALQGLGWNERQASEAVNAVFEEIGDEATTDSVLRFALAKLGSGKSMSK